MSAILKSLHIDELDLDQKLALVEELWESIASDSGRIPLTDAQRAELSARVADLEANPEDVIPLETALAEARKRLLK